MTSPDIWHPVEISNPKKEDGYRNISTQDLDSSKSPRGDFREVEDKAKSFKQRDFALKTLSITLLVLVLLFYRDFKPTRSPHDPPTNKNNEKVDTPTTIPTRSSNGPPTNNKQLETSKPFTKNYDCGIVYFLHCAKAGGSTVRDWLKRHTKKLYKYQKLNDAIVEATKKLEENPKGWYTVEHHNHFEGMLFRTKFLEELKEKLQLSTNCTLIRVVLFREPTQYYNSFYFWRKVDRMHYNEDKGGFKYPDYVGEYSQLNFFLYGAYLTPEIFESWSSNPHRHSRADGRSERMWQSIVKSPRFDHAKMHLNDTYKIKVGLELLEHFDLIGLTHKMDDALRQLEHILGLQDKEVNSHALNENKKHSEIQQVDVRELSEVIQAMRVEYQFYYRILLKFFDEEENFILKNR